MLPILTRYLTPEDYGIISVFTVLVSILAVFTGLSIHGAINVNFFKII
jgi:O-antigen/teichoic acid export membrane protein